MLLCETFDWLLWIRPIESLLGVNSVPSHASGKHAWVSWHGYQPPPLFIRSPTSSTSAVRSRINTAGPISTYMTIPPPPPPPSVSDNHTNSITTPITHRDTACTLFGLHWVFPVPFVRNLQAYPKHTHTHTSCGHTLSHPHLHHSHKYYF